MLPILPPLLADFSFYVWSIVSVGSLIGICGQLQPISGVGKYLFIMTMFMLDSCCLLELLHPLHGVL